MESYKDFSLVYDSLIDEDYEKWADYIEEIFKKYDTNPKLVLDLACGTGSVTKIMSDRGYEMIGVDISCDMLSVAQKKLEGRGIPLLCQDMREFELYGTVDAVICTLDSLNYILDSDDLLKVFSLVDNYLNPGGIFVFDLNTEYKISEVLGNNTYVYNTEDIFYTWENEYDEQEKICDFNLTFFVKDGEQYNRIDEVQSQRAYSSGEIENLLKKTNLNLLATYGAFSLEKPQKEAEKVFFVCKKDS